jgi:hypothetical protein
MKLTAYAPGPLQFNKYRKVVILLFALAGILQSGLKYEQIQEIKEKYNLVW